MYQALLGLTKIFGKSRDHPNHATTTICLANRKASHKRIVPQYIYIPFPKEMQFNEQTLCWRGWQMFWGKQQCEDLNADELNRELEQQPHAVVWFLCQKTNKKKNIFLAKQPNICIWKNYLRLFWNTQQLLWIVSQRVTSKWFPTAYSLSCWCFHHGRERQADIYRMNVLL